MIMVKANKLSYVQEFCYVLCNAMEVSGNLDDILLN